MSSISKPQPSHTARLLKSRAMLDDFIVNITTVDDDCKKNKIFSKKSVHKSKENKSKGKSNSSATVKHCSSKLIQNEGSNNTKSLSFQDFENFKLPKNPLQFGVDNKKFLTQSKKLDDLLSHPVEPNIEPVFSPNLWKDVHKTLNIHPHLLACLLERFKLKYLTAIQEATLSHLLNLKDVLVRAQTGSGKTLAYAVPLLNRLINYNPPISRSDGPLALIILPTRELATQTYDVFKTLTLACVRIVPGLFIGGMKRKSQKASLRKGVNVVIGTPQRLLDHMGRTASLNLTKIGWLVIDEADRLLEMGFERDIRHILENVKRQINHSELQTVLLSATLTPGVEALAGLTLKDPVRCVVKEVEKTEKISSTPIAQFSLPTGLKHFVIIVPWKLRLISLTAFLLLKCKYHKKGGKLIVFMATQDCVDFHYQLFKTVLYDEDESLLSSIPMRNLSIHRLHGSMDHKERESAFQQFSESQASVLITTDVASRGLDLASVAWVVQYHVTGGPIDYVHRVGRTARAGGRGKALLFLESEEISFLDLLKSQVGMEFEQLNLTDLFRTVVFHLQNVHRSKKQTDWCKTVEESTSQLFHLFLEAVDNDPTLLSLGETAYISFLRSYASFSGELRPIFTFKRLHLGHVARAFCLQKKPSDVSARVTGRFIQKTKNPVKSKSLYSGKHQSEDSDNEINNIKKLKKAKILSFEESENDVNSKLKHKQLIKPADLAKRNMLAEYGL